MADTSLNSSMSMQYSFRVGDPVWGKVKGFSAWPGKIVLPPDNLKVKIIDMPNKVSTV